VKDNASFANLAHLGQAVNLKTAGIGQDRFIPVHEIMQVAMLADNLCAGPQHQVKGIAQYDLGTDVGQFFRCHSFDCAIGADRHEGRCFDGAA